VVKKVIFN